MYKLCQVDLFKRLMVSKAGFVIQLIAGLCLESYIVQHLLFTDKMNFLFPLNLPVMYLMIFAVAYVLKCLSQVFSQVFSKEDVEVKKMFKL